MRFKIGDRVHLKVAKEFADQKKIKVNTCGNIVDIYDIFNAYLVKFDGVGLPRMILESDLAKGCGA